MDYREKFRQRLDELLDNQPISARQIARKLGWSVNTLSNWRTGIRRPKPEDIARLCLMTGESADWLLGLRGRVADAPMAAEAATEYGPDDAFAMLPLIVSASDGVPVFTEVNESPVWLAFRREWLRSMIGPILDERHGFMARVEDDDMHPNIRSGALVLVRRWQSALAPEGRLVTNGAVHLILDGDGALKVRRITLDAETNHLVVTADNPKCAPRTIDITDKDLSRIVLGQVVWVGQSAA